MHHAVPAAAPVVARDAHGAHVLSSGLPAWQAILPNRGRQLTTAQVRAALASYSPLTVTTDAMGEHFPVGTVVLAQAVADPADLAPGVYAEVYAGEVQFIARLTEQQPSGHLRFTEDARGRHYEVSPRLWRNPNWQLLRVTHYVSRPIR